MEAGIRTFCRGGQWQRGVDMFSALRAGGAVPASGTVAAVFQALGRGCQADAAHDLLEELASFSSDSDDDSSGVEAAAGLSAAYNIVARTCAVAGQVQRAVALLEVMVGDDAIVCESATFSTVAAACLSAGEQALAEDVLDMRDYL